MNTLQLYKNPAAFPDFASALTPFGPPREVTPRSQDYRTGFVQMQMTFEEVMSCNYLSIKRDSKTIYAYITNVEEVSGDRLYKVSYAVDAFRTYKNHIDLDVQFIERSPVPTDLEDPLLSSLDPYHEVGVSRYSWTTMVAADTRYAVIQKRAGYDEQKTNTPGNPSPYQFWVAPYNVHDWSDSAAIRGLINQLGDGGQTSDIVTIYSIPYIDLSGLTSGTLNYRVGSTPVSTSGWYFLNEGITDLDARLTNTIPINSILSSYENLFRTPHSVNVIIPDAGVVNIPDEFLHEGALLVRKIDLSTGACNYYVTDNNGQKMSFISARGSSVGSIPILSDPYDTYISQNQNTLAASMLGDVANIAVGIAGASVPGGAALGASLIGQGAAGLLKTGVQQADARNMVPSNPPAFLGSALLAAHSNTCYFQVIRKKEDNAAVVHARFGYPHQRIEALVLPSSGYIQTKNCGVKTDGTVPLWAVEEVNKMFDQGVEVV